jgi:hypothetical protein
MRKSSRTLAMFVILAFAAWAGFALATGAPTKGGPPQPEAHHGEGAGHSHERCELHGGSVSMTEKHHFETLFAADGIRIYMYSGEQGPMMITKAISGSVKFVHVDGTSEEVPLVADVPKNGEKAVYFCPMHSNVVQTSPGICPLCGGMKLFTQNRLYGKADLSKAEAGSLKAVVHLTGLRGPEKEATFTETNTPPAPESATPTKG